MTELTKNADVALVEVREKIYNRLTNLRQIQHDFREKAGIEPIWEGIVGQCKQEERFLSELLDAIERS